MQRNLEETKCQACGKEGVVILIDDVIYEVCHNCLIDLVNVSLSRKQFKALVEIHSDQAFLLHGDFYDGKGNALQPKT